MGLQPVKIEIGKIVDFINSAAKYLNGGERIFVIGIAGSRAQYGGVIAVSANVTEQRSR